MELHADERSRVRRRGTTRLVRRRAVPSGEERRRRRALPRGAGAIPLPRLIPCLDVAGGRVVKGVRFEDLRDVGDPVELGAAYSDAGADELVFLDVRATLDGPSDARRARRARGRAAGDPFHRRRRRAGAWPMREAAPSAPARTRSSVNSAALARPELVTELAARSARRRSSSPSTPSGGRVRSRAGTQPTGRGAVGWAREAERARSRGDPAHFDRHRRHARGLRPRADGRGRCTRSTCR